MANPGWYPDVSGRFRFRYHDGVRWTEHVVDPNGQRGTDPVGAGPPTTITTPSLDQTAPTLRRELPVAIAATGALLVLLSVFTLAFLGEAGFDVSLHQLGRIPRSSSGWPLSGYAELGRFATLPVAGLSVVVSTRWVGDEPRLMRVAAILAGVLGGWHLVGMFVTGELEASPAFGGYVGVAGYVGLVAGPWLRRRDLGPEDVRR